LHSMSRRRPPPTQPESSPAKCWSAVPGPVVVTPGAPTPTAIPEKVVLIHRGHTFESQSIHFPRKVPWVGSFSFTVPPGKYEVISTYTGPVRWVTVKAGGRYVVGFGLIACAD